MKTPADPLSTFALHDVRALDEAGGFSEPTDVLVEEGRVRSVGATIPAAVTTFDAAGLWLMPGIVDCHAHLGCFGEDDVAAMLSMSVTRWTTEALRNARTLLGLGITMVRDPATCDAGIRDGIATEAVLGPLMRVSGTALSQTGGHSDGYIPTLGAEAIGGMLIPEHPNRGPYLADGPDEMRAAVRRLLRLDVDWIKLCTTGGLLSSGRDHPLRQEFGAEEVAVAVAEAGRAGVPVCAHAYGGPGLDLAVEAGVRAIEHGIHLTEAQAAAMAERDCWLVPTLVVVRELSELADAGALSDYAAAKVREVESLAGAQVAVARAAGVRIAVGSDLVRQGANLAELSLLAAAGMPAEEVLLAATRGGAELLGEGEDRGRIAPGQVFDAVLLDRDPGDPTIFEDPEVVTGVFQGGLAVRPHERWRADGLPLPEVTLL